MIVEMWDEDVIYTLPEGGVPYPLGSGPHTLHLHWWQASADGGMRLLVDGTHAGEVTGIHLHVTEHRIDVPRCRHVGGFVELHLLGPPPTLVRPVGARGIDQDPPHELGGDREEVGSVAPSDTLLIHQPHVDLVDQGGGLEGVTGALAA